MPLCWRAPSGYSTGRPGGVLAMTQVFDAIIIGAGQAGPSLAGRLTAAGMRVALTERKLFGGTCVNTGCMPTLATYQISWCAGPSCD